MLDKPLEATITIKPEPKYPMQILSATPRRDDYIACELTRDEANGQYVIKVKNLRKKPGRFVDKIDVKTDSDIKPAFKIYVYGNLLKPSGTKSN